MSDNDRILSPMYSFEDVNAPVSLAKSEPVVVAIGNGEEYKGTADVNLVFLPQHRLEIVASFALPIEKFFESNLDDCLVKFPSRKAEVRVFAVQTSLEITTFIAKEGRFRHENETVLDTKKTVFHLINFVGFNSSDSRTVDTENPHRRLPFIVLKAEEWNIEISYAESDAEQVKKLEDLGGYFVTHIGVLKRHDGGLYDQETALEVLSGLQHFLSFSSGFWTCPALPVGLGDADEVMWRHWSVQQVDSYRHRRANNWYAKKQGEQLQECFQGFLSLYNTQEMGRNLQEALYWYLRANHDSSGIDAGIILSQAALELLSYGHCVEGEGLVTKDGFKSLRASGQIRLLLRALELSVELQLACPEMHKLSKEFNWIDAPLALTEIRNALIHPERDKRSKFQDSYVECWQLNLWYLETIILRLIGFKGEYYNRVSGQLDSM